MKKKIILIMLAVTFIIGGIAGGITYAADGHEPMGSDKLIGFESLGRYDFSDGFHQKYSWFVITNPDCEKYIDIDHVSIIHGNGTSVYEGLFYQVVVDNEPYINPQPVTSLGPHQVATLILHYTMPSGVPGEWLSTNDALNLPMADYTVEVFWSGSSKGQPLIGSSYQASSKHSYDGTVLHARTSTPMRNIVQR